MAWDRTCCPVRSHCWRLQKLKILLMEMMISKLTKLISSITTTASSSSLIYYCALFHQGFIQGVAIHLSRVSHSDVCRRLGVGQLILGGLWWDLWLLNGLVNTFAFWFLHLVMKNKRYTEIYIILSQNSDTNWSKAYGGSHNTTTIQQYIAVCTIFYYIKLDLVLLSRYYFLV